MISDRLRNVLRSAQSVAAFTGAGISAESGVPTFRSKGGIWTKMKPEELASMDGFMKNPDLVWEWYAQRKRIMADVQPNPGHRALAQMERLFPRFAIITQNIDNLHQRAGNTVVHELHGNIERNYCMACGKRYTNEEVLASAGVPRCSACGGTIRPDVVWFGEMLPEDAWDASVRAAGSADLFLSIGTSTVVYPAASLPTIALDAGAMVVEINPETTPLTSRVDEFLQGPAGTVLPELYDAAAAARKEKA
ncbi:MAG: NAD-dependent deacylase [Bacteroidetes bacterium]|nr:NAD-dependent deacylase [Bacteroidota bacterium]